MNHVNLAPGLAPTGWRQDNAGKRKGLTLHFKNIAATNLPPGWRRQARWAADGVDLDVIKIMYFILIIIGVVPGVKHLMPNERHQVTQGKDTE